MAKIKKSCGIELDFTNALSSAVGYEHGITPDDLNDIRPAVQAAYAAIEKARESGSLGFMKLPYTAKKEVAALEKHAKNIAQNFSDLVVLGIGGSSLGLISLQSALNHPFYNMLGSETRPRLYVLDNVDPEYISSVLDMVILEKTCFVVITKSGSTAETMSQFLVFRQMVIDQLGEEAYKRQFVIITDPKSGIMRTIADKEGLLTLPIPPDVGGRFSVLTPVGLLAASVIGVDIKALLDGAAAMDSVIQEEKDIYRNPAVFYAALMYLMDTRKRKPMAVMMPYVQSLYLLADWYRQLLAESIGKKTNRAGATVHTGMTPIKALGATDQHSQTQLYMEGPNDKVITLIGVKKYRKDITIPKSYKNIPQLSYLGGKKMSALIQAEQQASGVALAQNGRPNCTITLDTVNEQAMGALFYLFEYQIAVMGELYNIDAFDQPGVEQGKNLTYGMMGRAGYENQKELVEKQLASVSDASVIRWSV
ncbi:glucose-6-phosphate isomerase [bacterium]|nr:glucose-6-phosphate isomerase [bacterium]